MDRLYAAESPLSRLVPCADRMPLGLKRQNGTAMRRAVLITLIAVANTAAVAVMLLRKHDIATPASAPHQRLSSFVSSSQPFETPRQALARMEDVLAADDLAAAADQAIATNTSDMMLLGAQLIDRCAAATEDWHPQHEVVAALAAANDRGDPAGAALARAQQAALDRMRNRCRGFSTLSRADMRHRFRAVERMVCQHDDDVAALARAIYTSCDAQSTTPEALDRAVIHALREPNRIKVELAIDVLGGQLADRYSLGALQQAAALIYGDDVPWSLSLELDRLSLCLGYAPACGITAVTESSDPLVIRYAEALSAHDIEAIRKIQ